MLVWTCLSSSQAPSFRSNLLCGTGKFIFQTNLSIGTHSICLNIMKRKLCSKVEKSVSASAIFLLGLSAVFQAAIDPGWMISQKSDKPMFKTIWTMACKLVKVLWWEGRYTNTHIPTQEVTCTSSTLPVIGCSICHLLGLVQTLGCLRDLTGRVSSLHLPHSEPRQLKAQHRCQVKGNDFRQWLKSHILPSVKITDSHSSAVIGR